MPVTRCLILALACLLLSAAGASAAQVRGLQLPTLGADTTPRFMEEELDEAQDLGARLVRTEIRWSLLEPAAAGTRDPKYVATVDRFFREAAERGISVLVTFQGSPCWASSKGGACDSRSDIFPPTDPDAYASAAGFLAGRYGSRLAALEVWNEPDHSSEFYFAGPDKPRRYAAILRATYPRVKAASPSTKVLAGALVGANGAFLRALYAEGIKGSYDALSVHYYDLVLAALRSIRSVQRANGDSKPIWLGEFGWTSCSPKRTQGGHACVSPAQQAANLQDVFAALKPTSWVDAAVVYNIQDSAQYQFGVVDQRGRRKPAWTAMRGIFRSGPPPVRPVRVRLRRSGNRVIASGSAPAGDALEVDAYRGGRLAQKITLRPDRSGRFAVALSPLIGTKLRVRVYQYWSKRSGSARI